jgi:hypothetical protein
MSQQPSLQSLFEHPTTLPDPDAQGRLARLVGMDDKIKRLANTLGVLINPTGLRKWQDKHHSDASGLLDAVIRRPP